MAENIFENFDRYIPTAVDAAVPTATQWGAHRAEGGLLWATYKATCRRYGVFTGSPGPRDFNAELFDPISRHLAGGWERAFQRRLPAALDSFLRVTRAYLEKFHREAIERAKERGTNYNGLSMLSQQLVAHSQRIADVRAAVLGLAQELQRDANRAFTPVIQDEMMPAYDGCVAERGMSLHTISASPQPTNKLTSTGAGSYMRMKNIMVTHVTNRRGPMFRNATDVVQRQLEQLCDRIQQDMEAHVQELRARLARDYLAVLVGVDVGAIGAQGPSRVELMLRGEMLPLLAKSDGVFAEVFGEGIQGGGGVEEEEGDGTEEHGELVKDEPDCSADSITVKAEGD